MSEDYIRNHFDDIKRYADVIETRLDDRYCTMESVLEENRYFLAECRKNHHEYILIDSQYDVEVKL
ncbi:MAG: hypothetical protein IIY44_02695 [Erysipelotrichales bacterium]|nr:hypothetical protein [Erysipelotrichales bacterium]MBQ2309639.1 hypothetical protein [Erysipelotrichales bacterium]MBQ2479407.1 hypothetical protein [Erysipelotrichales bacterium]MBQ4012259.1 hypothetical protein [Erysipelotrichales bacterium]MBQ4375807.1 hypothetical protein [Erysipelotrichales bacterium]